MGPPSHRKKTQACELAVFLFFIFLNFLSGLGGAAAQAGAGLIPT